jgi:hypothetical protein
LKCSEFIYLLVYVCPFSLSDKAQISVVLVDDYNFRRLESGRSYEYLAIYSRLATNMAILLPTGIALSGRNWVVISAKGATNLKYVFELDYNEPLFTLAVIIWVAVGFFCLLFCGFGLCIYCCCCRNRSSSEVVVVTTTELTPLVRGPGHYGDPQYARQYNAPYVPHATSFEPVPPVNPYDNPSARHGNSFLDANPRNHYNSASSNASPYATYSQPGRQGYANY